MSHIQNGTQKQFTKTIRSEDRSFNYVTNAGNSVVEAKSNAKIIDLM